MLEERIEFEADSLKGAQQQAISALPSGLEVLSEEIHSDGKVRIVEAVANTIDDAFAQAERKVPECAEIVERSVKTKPQQETIRVRAFDKKSAKVRLQQKTGQRIEAVMIKSTGSKGFLGIGRTPNEYELRISQKTIVRISYREKVRISVLVGKGVGLYGASRQFFTEFPDLSLANAQKLIRAHGRPVKVYIAGGHDVRIQFKNGSKFVLGGFTVGYVGTGPKYTKAFLDEAGFSISIDQIAEMRPPILLVAGQSTRRSQIHTAKTSAPVQPATEKGSKLKYLLVLIDELPVQGEDFFIEQMLDSLYSEGRLYRECTDSQTQTALRAVGEQVFFDSDFAVASASLYFKQIWNCKPDVDNLRFQLFRGAGGNGVVVEQW